MHGIRAGHGLRPGPQAPDGPCSFLRQSALGGRVRLIPGSSEVAGGPRCRPCEPGTDVIAAHVTEFVKYREGLPPRGAGHLRVSGGAVDVAEAGQDGCLLRPVAHLPKEAERTLVAGYRRGIVAELLPGKAQMIPRVGFLEGTTDFAVQIESLATTCHGRRIITERCEVPAKIPSAYASPTRCPSCR